MALHAAGDDYDRWRSTQMQDLVDEFLADLAAVSDLEESDAVAELEHAALVLRVPFDALGAPPSAATDLVMAIENRGDDLAAGVLAALAAFSHEPLAGDSANALARLSGHGTIHSLAKRIGTLEVVQATRREVPRVELALVLLQRPDEPRAQLAMVSVDSYPCGKVISHLEVKPLDSAATVRECLSVRMNGTAPRPLASAELLEGLRGAADHMDRHAVPLESGTAVWLPVLTRALTGSPSGLPRLAVEPLDREDREDATREHSVMARDGDDRDDKRRRRAKRRAARAARSRNKR